VLLAAAADRVVPQGTRSHRGRATTAWLPAQGCVSDTIFPLQSKIKILLLEGVSDEAVNILKQEGFNVRARPQSSHAGRSIFDLCGRHLYSILLFLDLFIDLFYLQVEAHRGKLPDDELAEKIRDAHCVGIRYERRITTVVFIFYFLFYFSTELFWHSPARATRVCDDGGG
jgi:hypothetical protein